MNFLIGLNPIFIFFKFSVFVSLMLMAFLEAKLYIDDGNLKNKKTFYLISFISSIIVGSFLLLPVVEFDLMTLGLYVIRTIVVGILFVKYNHKKTNTQARNDFLWVTLRIVLAFVLFNFVFLLLLAIIGSVITVLQ